MISILHFPCLEEGCYQYKQTVGDLNGQFKLDINFSIICILLAFFMFPLLSLPFDEMAMKGVVVILHIAESFQWR